jgi:hypothetical protein
MSERRATESRARAREHGLARIRLLTRRIAAVSVAGCAVFAGLAAVDGKSGAARTGSTSTPTTTAVKKVAKTTRTPAAVAQPTTTTTAPVVTVTPTQAAPVTVSGGS